MVRKGFTLVEVMVAASVLAFGMVLVLQAFFTVINAFGRYSNELNVMTAAEERLWEAQDEIARTGIAEVSQAPATLTVNGKSYRVEVNIARRRENLFEVDVFVRWQERNRQAFVRRTGYAYGETNEEKE